MFLYVVLYFRVYGGDGVIAVFGGIIVLKLGEHQVGPRGGGGADSASGSAGKHRVVFVFDTAKSVVVGANKAYDMAGQRAVGVIALGVCFQMYAHKLVGFFEFLHLI